MKSFSRKDICNLTSSGFTGQYVLWRGQLPWTGFGTESIGRPMLTAPASSQSEFRTVTFKEHQVESAGTFKATTDGRPSLFAGESTEES